MSDLRCPECSSRNIVGHQANRLRVRCKDCQRTFTVPEGDYPFRQAEVIKDGVEVDGNYAQISYTSETEITAEEVMEKFGFDPEEWMVDEPVKAGMHQGFYKKRDKNSHQIVEMYRIEIRLVRKVPSVCEWPMIQGAKIAKWKPVAKVERGGLLRALAAGDGHFGYRRNLDTGLLTPMHDERFMNILARVIIDQRPDLVLLGGDMLDLPDWNTTFVRTPDCRWTTQASINRLGTWIMSWRRYAGRVVYMKGNHENRMMKLICNNAEAAFGLRRANCPEEHPTMSVPHLLNLDEMGVEWIDDYEDGVFWFNKRLRALHNQGTSSKPGATVGKALVKPGQVASVIFFHDHTDEHANVTVQEMDGEQTYSAHCLGTGSRLDKNGAPNGDRIVNWQQSFGLIDYEEEFPYTHNVNHILVRHGRCIVEGKLYEAEVEDERMTA